MELNANATESISNSREIVKEEIQIRVLKGILKATAERLDYYASNNTGETGAANERSV